MKRLLIGFAALLVLGAVAFLALASRLDPEELAARFVDEVQQKTGIRIESEHRSLYPWRGLELTNARASGQLDPGDFQVEVAQVRMRPRVWPLLRGELVIDEILLMRPTIELVTRSVAQVLGQETKSSERKQRREKGRKRKSERDTEDAGAMDEAGAKGEIRLSIVRLAIHDGILSVRSRDREEADFAVEDLNLDLGGLVFDPGAPSGTRAVAGQGRISTGRIVHGSLEALDSSGRIRLAGGVARLSELNAQSVNADLMVSELTILLGQEPPAYDLVAAGGLDLNGILDVEGSTGFGAVGFALGAAGEGPELGEMLGKGTVTLNPGVIPGLPSVVSIEELVGRDLLTGRKYERTEITYRLTRNKIVLEPFEIVGEGANIGGSGEIDLAGALDLEMAVRLPRSGLEGANLDPESRELSSDTGGWVKIPFEVHGTLEDPKVSLTWDGARALASDAAKGWVELTLEEAKKKAEEWLKSQADERDGG